MHWVAERAIVSSVVFCAVWMLRSCWRALRANQRRALGDPLNRRSRAASFRASRSECQALLLPVSSAGRW